MSTPIYDADLINALCDSQQRDEAFKTLVKTYGPDLHRLISRMLPAGGEVDDVLQETFVKVYRSIDRFKGEAKLSTWLYRIATNEALTWLRRNKRRMNVMDVTSSNEMPYGQIAEPWFDADEVKTRLRQAVRKLPDKQKLVFLLRYYDNLPYQQISKITGTSLGGLKANYHLAIKKIEQEMISYVDTK